MPRYHVKITGRDYEAMADLVRKYKVGVARHTVEKVAKGYRIDAHANGRQLSALEAAGYGIERYEDADKEGKARQKEVRKVSKKAAPDEALHVPGANKYLNVVEVETALAAVAGAHAGFTKLITLPNKTWERRVCHALKIGKGSGNGRPAIYFSNNFTADQIKKIVETKDTYLFPQANPDGRHYSMTTEAMWRKNRRPAPAGHKQSKCVGVDLNRNFDFMWNFPGYFDPNSPISNSTDPCDHDIYIGPAAMSEPETKNAVWIFDQYPIGYFIDVHSYSEDILYSWGDDEDQSADPSMNFQNAAFNGKRGIAGDTKYKEYIAAADKAVAVNLANKMQAAIQGVRGRVYKVEQSMTLYPTAGTSDDYAFSRHVVNSKKSKTYSYTIEWGSPKNTTPFHPPYPEMQKIIQEITTALLAFCLAVT